MKTVRIFCILLLSLSLWIPGSALFAADKTIVEDWGSIKTPPPPPLSSVVEVEPASTALLMLDFSKQTCNMERRPRCIATLPDVGRLLDMARKGKLAVIHSLAPGAAAADIAEAVAPRAGEPVVQSGPDKFLGTDLEKILKDKKIKTVIVVGTAAHGAVLYTASGAALRNIDVIVPIDGMSAEDAFAEQYVAWHLKNAPRIGARTVLTKISIITIQK